MIKIHGMVLAIVTEDPAEPVEGQIWYNSMDDQLKFFDHHSSIQPVNDIYQGITPPLNTYEIVWLKTDENLFFVYDANINKWVSSEKLEMNFGFLSKTYSGNLAGYYYIKNQMILKGIHTSDFVKTIIVNSDSTEIYRCTAPFESYVLNNLIPGNTTITCYTPSERDEHNHQMYVTYGNVYLEALRVHDAN